MLALKTKTPGQASDLTGADALLPELGKHGQAVLADRAYDAQERVLAVLEQSVPIGWESLVH